MAAKARLMADVIEKALLQDDSDSNLKGQMEAFKDILIHDITPKEFADVYAQTIVYGMFAARLHDTTPDTFSRHEAATLIPKTNPFLRQLFQNVAGYDLDDRISWIVDDSAEIFRAADMRQVMAGFGHRTQQTDPMIHFYEDFLAAYDPKQRKNRGVWYTPQAVVSCIVKTVDEILQAEFNLPMGLADTSKITVERSIDQSKDKRFSDGKKKETVKIHKVQLLDPATGTGTFLAEAVSRIHDKFNGQAGMWQGYVGEHLLPRLNGFELLMTSYTMAHLKLDWILTETGYKADDNERLRVFLTNSLEEHHKDTGTLFAQFLAREANGANEIKRNTPVMVVLGNPPYSGESKNKGEWIMRLMEDYKKEPDTNQPLKERNPKWINDDYCNSYAWDSSSWIATTKGYWLMSITIVLSTTPLSEGCGGICCGVSTKSTSSICTATARKRGCTRRRQRRKRIRHTTGRLNQYLRKNGTQGKECPCRSISSRPIRPKRDEIRLLVVAYGGEHPVRETSAVRTGIFLRAEKLRSKSCV